MTEWTKRETEIACGHELRDNINPLRVDIKQ